jgi:transposase
MEACGGAQHWARRLIEMGHQVKLMPAKFVKAFVIGNKNDPADARAIWMASQEWLVRFMEHRIADQRIIRLVRKWLKAGVLEDGELSVRTATRSKSVCASRSRNSDNAC